MKEFIEKLIARLEEQQAEAENEMHRLRSGDYTLPCSYDITDIKEIASESFKESIQIVNELAEEYINTSTDTSTTNADKIRSMTDEELAEFLCKLDTMGTKPKSLWNGEFWIDEGEELLNWLQSEVEGE